MAKNLTVPVALAEASGNDYLLSRISRGYNRSDDIVVYQSDMTDDVVEAIRVGAVAIEHNGLRRMAEAILAARSGDTNVPIPRLHAAPDLFIAYFREHLRDGWLYERGTDDHLHAWLVTDIQIVEPNNDSSPYLSISMTANGRGGRRSEGLGAVSNSATFDSKSLVRKKVANVLTAAGLYIETPALRAEYNENLAKYEAILGSGFTEQYRFNGTPLSVGDSYSYHRPEPRSTKVIHDIPRSDIPAPVDLAETILFAPDEEEEQDDDTATERRRKARNSKDDPGVGPVPTHFMLRCFDLATHEFMWVNTNDCEPYVYDKTLSEKIVLPEDQRNLLDILTTDLDDFTGDVIEGKSTGNVVLAKGEPGVGKTLTAEVYSELIERPLYSIHSGNLGVTADKVRENLEITFKRAKRWKAVLLLDEADVFVLERGSNITQNAIVAEFLRTLEYFDGLMFMTTNRANNIDDAILSRAAAIIDYKIPDIDGIREVWRVQARNQSTVLPDDLLDALVHGFKKIAPRDVKMLLRLALRVAKGNGHDLDVATFQRCAMFRGLHFEPGSRIGD